MASSTQWTWVWAWHAAVHGVAKSWLDLVTEPQQYLPEELPWRLSGKESTCQRRRHGFDPLVRKIPWRRKWQPTPVFLPGKSYRQRSPTGYSPWGRKRVWHDLATKRQRQHMLARKKEKWELSAVKRSLSKNGGFPTWWGGQVILSWWRRAVMQKVISGF